MKRFYLNMRALLLTFAFGLASVNLFQSFSIDSLNPWSEPQSAVIIVPVSEMETRSRVLESYTDKNVCGGWPILDYEASPKKSKKLVLKRKFLKNKSK